MELFIPIILGTSREGRSSERVAHWLTNQATALGVDTQLIDVRHFTTMQTVRDSDLQQEQEWDAIAAKADGFIVVTPEYNHSYPGEFKILFDKAYGEYNKKVMGICAVSSGGFGGTRVAESLLPVLGAVGLSVPKNRLHISTVEDLFDAEGNVSNEEQKESLNKKAMDFINEVTWYAQTLKAGREQQAE